MIIGATTWTSRSYGVGRELGRMRGRIKNHVNEFIKAYSSQIQNLTVYRRDVEAAEKKYYHSQ